MGKEEWCEHLTWNDCGRWTFCDEHGTLLDHPKNKGFSNWKFCPICATPRPKEDELKGVLDKYYQDTVRQGWSTLELKERIDAWMRRKIDGITLTVDKRIEISKALGL